MRMLDSALWVPGMHGVFIYEEHFIGTSVVRHLNLCYTIWKRKFGQRQNVDTALVRVLKMILHPNSTSTDVQKIVDRQGRSDVHIKIPL